MRPYQLATAAALIGVAAVAMVDSRRWALIDASGAVPGGMGAGFYPFWSAVLMAGSALILVSQTLRNPQAAKGVFEGRQGFRDVLLLIIPMAVAIGMIDKPLQLGFYVVAALYMAFFTRVVGGYRPQWVVLSALVVSVGLFVIFEQGFRVPLPKSFLYDAGVLPF